MRENVLTLYARLTIIMVKGGAGDMAQTNLNIRIDEDLKEEFSQFCDQVGMSMTTAFTIFAKKAVKEQRIPFEITGDPFYSPANMARLRKAAAEMDAGLGTPHELIEGKDDEDMA